jgi:hypothetical protein
MFGKETPMTALESRKQLLVLESELNRAQLMKDLDELKVETQRLGDQVRSLGSIASNVGSLLEMVFKAQQFVSNAKEKFPRIFGLFKGARAGASLWSVIRAWLR